MTTYSSPVRLTTSISGRIAKISLIAAVMVVAQHISDPHCSSSVGWWFSKIVCRGVCSVAVPIFFAISGYLLVGHVDESNWWRKAVEKRFRTLVLPYFCWCIAFSAFAIPILIAASLHAGKDAFAGILTGWRALRYLGLDPFSFPSHGTLWYVRALVVLIMLSPLFVVACRIAPKLFLAFIYLATPMCDLWLSSSPTWGHFFSRTIPVCYFLFFASGICARLYGWRRPSRVCGCVLLALGCVCYVIETLVLYRSGQAMLLFRLLVSQPAIILGLFAVVTDCQWPQKITSFSFPIFILQPFLITIYNVPWGNHESVGGMLFEFAFILFGCVFCIIVMRKTCPRLTSFLCGGR